MKNLQCPDCFPYPEQHKLNWFRSFVNGVLSPIFVRLVPRSLEMLLLRFSKRLLQFFGLVRYEENFDETLVNPISLLFIREARKRGVEVLVAKSGSYYSNFFQLRHGKECLDFEVLPNGNGPDSSLSLKADDKWIVKNELMKLGFPVMSGKAFSFLSSNFSILLYLESLGYPVVMKPRAGTLSQHLHIVRNRDECERAVVSLRRYSPFFIVEKFLPDATLYRLTVVDDRVYVSRRLPPRILGDGIHTVAELLQERLLLEVCVDVRLLSEQGFSFDSIPGKDQVVLLHTKILHALQAEFRDIPLTLIHPDIVLMSQEIAKHFSMKFVGLDFLTRSISEKPREGCCAFLELNSMPNIQMHTFLENGVLRNRVSEALVDFVLNNHR